MKKGYLFIAVALAFIAAPAYSETITLQQGANYWGTSDCHIFSYDGNQNQMVRKADGSNGGNGTATATTGGYPQNTGGWDYIEEGDYTVPHPTTPLIDDSKCILIKFDLSGVKAVTSAKLGIYYWFERNGGDVTKEKSGTSQIKHTLNVNRLLKDWGMGSGGGNGVGVDGSDQKDNAGSATWNSTGYEFWQAIGAEGPEDIAPTETTTVFDPAVGGWVWFDVTASAKFWVATPNKNFGVKIGQEVYPAKFNDPDLTLPNGKKVYKGAPVTTQTDFVSGAYDFVSSSNKGKPALRPQLVIEGTSSASSWEIFQ